MLAVRSVAELPEHVAAPRPERVIGLGREGEVEPGTDRRPPDDGTDPSRDQPVSLRAVSDLADAVRAPRPQASVRTNRYRVCEAPRQCDPLRPANARPRA